MTRFIFPNIDAYGTYARVSALADWVEIATWHGRRVNRAQLEDLIFDNNWTTKRPQQFIIGLVDEEEGSDDDGDAMAQYDSDVPELWSDAVLSILKERQAILNGLWPFEIRGDWHLVAKPSLNNTSPYLALLCLTVAHAWGLDTTLDPKVVIEDTVFRALAQKGLNVIPMGTGDRAGSSFQKNLNNAAALLGLRALDPAEPAKLHAKDAGVDTMFLVGWKDPRRAGQWLTIGQVTIAKSDRWQVKIAEPRRDHWAGYFFQPIEPNRFLAVPHHVEVMHLEYLVGRDTGLVVDRLRLTQDLISTSEDEKSIIDELRQLVVDDGRSVT